MTTIDNRARRLVMALAAGTDIYAGTATGTDRLVASTVGGILHGVAALLEQRNPEEVRQLIVDLATNPVPKIDTSADDAMIDGKIAKLPERR